ncbi:cell death regulator Aven-like, partial [Ananas comosus]|uniref:Cell death regulator Aven-like n=1 Tax=Ananas comosus TaxID=4615 RepID=A0A6P5EMU7_ANACO
MRREAAGEGGGNSRLGRGRRRPRHAAAAATSPDGGGGAGGRDGGRKDGKRVAAVRGWRYQVCSARADLGRLQGGRSDGSGPQGRRPAIDEEGCRCSGEDGGSRLSGGCARAAAGTRLGRALSQAAAIGLGGSSGA